jgi:hypothetical protein
VLTSAEEVQYFEPAEQIGHSTEDEYGRAVDGICARREKKPNPLMIRFGRASWRLSAGALRHAETRHSGWLGVKCAMGRARDIRKTCERAPPCSDDGKSLSPFRNARSVARDEWISGAHRERTHRNIHVQESSTTMGANWATSICFRCTHSDGLTRWSAHKYPYTPAYVPGRVDFAMTARYVHPQAATVRAVIGGARPAPEGAV